ncbi:MAG: hypothetical protein IH604_14470 [Burkholderiales bacterium]|nr:hypothetical protein [Burkholderiales bacterium]
MTTINVPLPTLVQIQAAGRLHDRLAQWRMADAALLGLHQSMPGFDPVPCLLKAVVVNALYGTQVFAIVRMAEHIGGILRGRDIAAVGPDDVEAIADLPTVAGGGKRRFVSFAAKFCHFFIDAERFPIYDDAARVMLRHHLGSTGYLEDGKQPYVAFCRAFQKLRTDAHLVATSRDLDRYLWIAGMYLRWLGEREKEKPQLNVELRGLFDKPDKEAAKELDAMLPPSFSRPFLDL